MTRIQLPTSTSTVGVCDGLPPPPPPGRPSTSCFCFVKIAGRPGGVKWNHVYIRDNDDNSCCDGVSVCISVSVYYRDTDRQKER